MSVPFLDLKLQYQAMKEQIDQSVHKVLDHCMFVMGPEVRACEEALEKYTGAKHCLTAGSGTDALLMAMLAMGIKPGDEVITTPFSFIATAETIVLAGATPVFVDIEPDTYNIDAKKIEGAITKNTKAIMPVSLYGQTADMDAINEIACKNNLLVIEDAAQSFGATYNGKQSCNLGYAGATSFFPAKPLGCYGDGGAVFTNDSDFFKKMEEIRNHGSESRYYHTRIGINGRMDTIQCAIIIEKLHRYKHEVETRQKLADQYNQAFSALKEKDLVLPELKPGRTSVWAQYTLAHEKREQIMQQLKEKGIPTAVHYPQTMADQPAYTEICITKEIPLARKAANEVFSLPIYPDMPLSDHEKVCESVIEVIRKI